MAKRRSIFLGAVCGYAVGGLLPCLLVFDSVSRAGAKPNPDPSAGAVTIVIPVFVLFVGPIAAVIGGVLVQNQSQSGTINPLSSDSKKPLLVKRASYIEALSSIQLDQLDEQLVGADPNQAANIRASYLKEHVEQYRGAMDRSFTFVACASLFLIILVPIGWFVLAYVLWANIQAVKRMRILVHSALERWRLEPGGHSINLPLSLR